MRLFRREQSLDRLDRGEADGLWAARAGTDLMSQVDEKLAEADRAKGEETIRTGRFEEATTLDFSGRAFGDDDLARLPAMPELEDLELARTWTTDTGLARLHGLDSLDYLGLAETAVVGAGLASFAGTPLTRVDLSRSEITNDGLRYLAALESLSLLWLDGTQVTDAGLVHLFSLPLLAELHLSDTAVSDASLGRLLNHPNLMVVYARRTRVTEAMVEKWLERERLLTIQPEENEARDRAQAHQWYADHLFEETQERWYESAVLDNPVGGDVSRVLLAMSDWLGKDMDDRSRSGLYTIGVRAYLWREAEQGPTSFVDDAIRKSIKSSLDEGQGRSSDEGRSWTLFHAAARCLEDNVSVGLGSPGGLMYGTDFLWRGFDAVRCDFDEHGFSSTLPNNTQRLGFRFGVCLRDVVRLLEGDEATFGIDREDGNRRSSLPARNSSTRARSGSQ